MQRVIYILIFVLSFSSASFAQLKDWQKAQQCYQDDSLVCAQTHIDAAITNDAEKELAYTWHLRGYIYKAIYKKNRTVSSKYREVAIEAYKTSLALDSIGEFNANNTSAIRSMAATYYNDCVGQLNNFNVEEADRLLSLHNETMNIVEPGYYSLERELPIYRRAGTVYMDKYQDDKKANIAYFDKAVETFDKVLNLDSTDFKSNLNAGVLYHNRGVEMLMEINGDIDFMEMIEREEQALDYMTRALSYMRKAYQLSPDHPGVIRGLAGIYYILHNEEKFAFFNEKLLKLEGDN